MGLFRFRKAPATESTEATSSWSSKLKFSPFSRSESKLSSRAPIAAETIGINGNASMLQRANTTSTMSQTSSQPSIAGSRPSSEVMCASPTESLFPSSLPQRTSSMYSHRSYSIRRDSIKGRPPVLPRSSQSEVSQSPSETPADDGLVLTATSRYPTGIAAELYIPEDCTYSLVTQREKDARRQELKEQLRRNASMNRRPKMIQSPQDKMRLKRISVNF